MSLAPRTDAVTSEDQEVCKLKQILAKLTHELTDHRHHLRVRVSEWSKEQDHIIQRALSSDYLDGSSETWDHMPSAVSRQPSVATSAGVSAPGHDHGSESAPANPPSYSGYVTDGQAVRDAATAAGQARCHAKSTHRSDAMSTEASQLCESRPIDPNTIPVSPRNVGRKHSIPLEPVFEAPSNDTMTVLSSTMAQRLSDRDKDAGEAKEVVKRSSFRDSATDAENAKYFSENCRSSSGVDRSGLSSKISTSTGPLAGRPSIAVRASTDENVLEEATALGFVRKQTRGIFNRGIPATRTGLRQVFVCIVYSKHFESLCATIIFLNGILIGVSSDYAMANLENPKSRILSIIELGFTTFYIIELTLKIGVFGCGFFRHEGWRWNWFDCILVLFSVWDQIEENVDALQGGSAMKNLSFLRMLRLMKMLKLLRMIRLMRMFRELRLILHSVLGCVQAMFWAILLILTISYMFAICFLQACTSYLQSQDQANLDPDDVAGIAEYWSSVGSSMLSLYLAATNGEAWGTVARPLRAVGMIFYLGFLLYIALFAFVIMNTVTGLFIEATIANSDKDQQMIIQMELEKKGEYIDKLQAFYDEMDDNQDGQISYEEFCHHVNNPEMRAFATSMEIDVLDAKQFFCILSDNGRRCVDVETFVVGCIKLKGAARSMDLMDLVYQHRAAHSENMLVSDMIMEGLERLEGLLERLPSRSEGATVPHASDVAGELPKDKERVTMSL